MAKRIFNLSINQRLLAEWELAGFRTNLLHQLYHQADLVFGQHNWYTSRFQAQENDQTLTVEMEVHGGKAARIKQGEPTR